MSLSSRMVWIILGLTVIALGLVHVRRQEAALMFALQGAQSQHAALRREIWDRHVEIGRLTTPELINHRAGVMALDMTYSEPRLSGAFTPEPSDETIRRRSTESTKRNHSSTSEPLW